MKKPKKYSGVVVPMITPFTEKGKVDITGVSHLVNHLIDAGTDPFIIGTTGESASISAVEKNRLIEATVKATNGRAKIYAGISGNCLQDSISDAEAYYQLGVNVAVATLPYYYPLDEEQMLKYFETLADNIPCPLIIYNIPATTHLSIPIAVVDKLSQHKNIVGFKDSEKGIERIDAATTLWRNREDFAYLLGWAAQSAYAMNLGADGVVPSTGNISPAVYKTIVHAAINGEKEKTAKAQDKADRISHLYQHGRSLSHSLSALKAMLSGYGLCESFMLPPLYRMPANEEKRLIETCLSNFGELNKINSTD